MRGVRGHGNMYVQTPEGVWAAKVMFGSWDTQASFVCYYIDGLSY